MNTVVKINDNDYYANKRRIKRSGDRYDAVFRPVGKRQGVLILRDCITKRKALTGGSNGIGPFGSPHRVAVVYNIKNWGQVTFVDQRAWQCLANQVNKEE